LCFLVIGENQHVKISRKLGACQHVASGKLLCMDVYPKNLIKFAKTSGTKINGDFTYHDWSWLSK